MSKSGFKNWWVILCVSGFVSACNQAPVDFGDFETSSGSGSRTAPAPEQGSGNTPSPDPVPPPAPPVTPPPAPTPPPVATKVTEDFVAPRNNTGDIDILFIVDNSPSMEIDQLAIGNKFSSFSQELMGFDWQIGITTTDTHKAGALDGNLSEFKNSSGNLTGQFILTPSNINSLSFINTLHRTERGSSYEMGIKATLHALAKKDQNPNRSFFRPDTPLAVVVVSDEDELSSGLGRTGNNPVAPNIPAWSQENEPQYLVDTIKSTLDVPFTFNAIGVVPGDGACQFEQANQADSNAVGNFANVYKEAVDLTGGVLESICSPDFSPTLKGIARSIKKLLYSITLSHVPKPGTVSVTLNPADPGITWEVIGDKIFFKESVPEGTQIKVEYEIP